MIRIDRIILSYANYVIKDVHLIWAVNKYAVLLFTWFLNGIVRRK